MNEEMFKLEPFGDKSKKQCENAKDVSVDQNSIFKLNIFLIF